VGVDTNTTWYLCCHLIKYTGLNLKLPTCFRKEKDIINVSHHDELFCDKHNFVPYVELTLYSAFHGLVCLFKPSFASYVAKLTCNICCLKDTNIQFVSLNDGGTVCFTYQIQSNSRKEATIIQVTYYVCRAIHGKEVTHIIILRQVFM
jgi:hypothetical protein